MGGIVAHFGQRACGINDKWPFKIYQIQNKPKFTLVGVYLELIQDFSLSWNFTQIKGSIAKSQRSMRIRKWFHYIHPLIDFGERTPRHLERKMSLMVKMTINLLWDVDGWMSKGKRWVGTAEGKQRSCTDGAVPETLTVGPKIWRIFEKEKNIDCWLLSEHWQGPAGSWRRGAKRMCSQQLTAEHFFTPRSFDNAQLLMAMFIQVEYFIL